MIIWRDCISEYTPNMGAVINGWELQRTLSEWATTDGRMVFAQRKPGRWNIREKVPYGQPSATECGLVHDLHLEQQSLREIVQIYHECIGTSTSLRMRTSVHRIIGTPFSLWNSRHASRHFWVLRHNGIPDFGVPVNEHDRHRWNAVAEHVTGSRHRTRHEAIAVFDRVYTSVFQ